MQFLIKYRGMLVTTVIALAVGLASYAVVRNDPMAQRSSRPYTLDLSGLYEVDPKLVQYGQTAEIQVELEEVRALSIGPADKVFVAGDQMIRVFSPDGKELATIRTSGEPNCVAIGSDEHQSPGRIYVGAGNRIEVFDQAGNPAGMWNVPGDNPILASIAVTGNTVLVADAGNRVVLQYDAAGQLLGNIGDASGSGRTFNVPSVYFDIAMGPEGMVHVANPGALRIESYTFDGEMQIRWGEAGSAIDNFFGCCNPSHIAVLPTGGIVTSEKGVPRIKVYSEHGEFECVVAGPQLLGIAESELGDPRTIQAKAVFDVATDSQGRILTLDPRRKSVRVFERIDQEGTRSARSQ